MNCRPGMPRRLISILLRRRQAPLDPDKALARGQLGVDVGLVQLRQNRQNCPGRLARIGDLAGVGIKRRAAQRRRQELAVAVDDVGPRRRRRRRPPAEPCRHALRPCRPTSSGIVSKRSATTRNTSANTAATSDQPAAAGLDRNGMPLVGDDRRAGSAAAGNAAAGTGFPRSARPAASAGIGDLRDQRIERSRSRLSQPHPRGLPTAIATEQIARPRPARPPPPPRHRRAVFRRKRHRPPALRRPAPR